MGSKPKLSTRLCPNCEGQMHEIWFQDNYGEEMLLETHCNICKYAEDSEGKVRYPGNVALEGLRPTPQRPLIYTETNNPRLKS